jgi:uncharacterized protein YijF (DUF1287 family)
LVKGLHRLPPVAAAVLAAAPSLADPLARSPADQVGVTVSYDPFYAGLNFPGGDAPRNRGVCTDVAIRALCDARGIDLRLAVNRDMTANFAAYPALWGLSTTDRNIDHRRVPDLETRLRRIGAAEGPSDDPGNFAPGEIVSWRLAGSGLPHIAVTAGTRSADGAHPQVTHNIGRATRTEDILFAHDMGLRARLEEAARDRLRALTR